jgi:hypothetical protein
MKKAILFCIALALTSASAFASEHIINGHFSDPDPFQQTGWTVSSNFYFFDGGAYLEGSTGEQGALSQVVTGATGSLTLSFDLLTTYGYAAASWNGNVVNIVYGASPLTHYSVTVFGTGHDTLKFLGENLPSYNELSNVSLTDNAAPVPEPETYGMLLGGLGLLGVVARRKKMAGRV